MCWQRQESHLLVGGGQEQAWMSGTSHPAQPPAGPAPVLTARGSARDEVDIGGAHSQPAKGCWDKWA